MTRRAGFPTVVVALSFAVFASIAAAAASFTVNSTADEPDAAPGDGVCVTASGTCTLRAAIQEGNALSSATITLPAGLYLLQLPGVDEDAAATGDLDVVKSSITITGFGPATTIIDGNYLDRVFQVIGRADLTLNNVTVQHGSSELMLGTAAENRSGLAASLRLRRVLAQGAPFGPSLTLNNSILRDNVGGILGFGGLQVLSSSVLHNSGAITFNGALRVVDSSITDNATGITAAASEGEDVEIATSVLARNAWGVSLEGYGGNASITDTLIADNTAAGVRVGLQEQVAIVRCTISGNSGGGIATFSNDSSIFVSESTVSNNSVAGDGGGIHSDSCNPTSIVNSTISGNQATGNGGGLYSSTQCTSNELRLRNVTITANRADADHDGSGDGGGIFVIGDAYSSPNVANSIIAGNSDGGNQAPDCASNYLDSKGYNLIGNPSGCNMVGDTAVDEVGVSTPELSPLQDNGGPTLTHALLLGSPAIDAGDPAGCRGADDQLLITDQRGVARPQGPACDVGAVEFAPLCGNGAVDPGEECDDGNLINGDGCSAICMLQDGFRCSGAPSVCIALTPTPTPAPGSTSPAATSTPVPGLTCTGDCAGQGQVTVAELTVMVNIALGSMPVSACTNGDADHDGRITVAEIVEAVNNALSGCT